MKQIIIIFLTILTPSCNQNNKPIDVINTLTKEVNNDDVESFSIIEASAFEFELANSKYENPIVYDSITYKKKDGAINLPINSKWKPFVTFIDTLLKTDETEIREYYYMGQFKNIGFYLVSGTFWEYSENSLVNKRTGNVTSIWNTPIISPNEKFIANLSMPYGLEGIPNGIQIWSVEKNEKNQAIPISISKHIEIDQSIWIPVEITWESDVSLILKVVSIHNFLESGGKPEDKDHYFLRLNIN